MRWWNKRDLQHSLFHSADVETPPPPRGSPLDNESNFHSKPRNTPDSWDVNVEQVSNLLLFQTLCMIIISCLIVVGDVSSVSEWHETR